ncbi:hypothetical protein ACRHK7_06200 [Weissella tructae]|uniref:Uncharacterized protein n=2 Tax=Weissella TaxID=46255 RepID=A0A075TZ32_9LACO|nr:MULTISPECIES: hypothetical protein [Weissella]AIG65561.1 hypothetical protein WS08_0622 [Weissella tructae]AIM62875.1 hypothetical protein WS74_0623 [Weissella ceti]AIM64273.1 hypothetical protein WS105_0683 [Weissella ceti]ELA06981.1 hypothetical protein WCNC_05357 [Weissella ceti NC36]QVV90693.1 hypothetical protein KHQ32_03385 [Weissella tructae]
MGQKDLRAKLQIANGNPNHRDTQKLKEQSELEDKIRGDGTNIEVSEWLEQTLHCQKMSIFFSKVSRRSNTASSL